ncbi:hypothetical protein, partial [Mycoplasmopsis synoviae]|uniref:hypothetical protein n=1 Tax=Mycoplasmopsis synoviae TaxID=2109 RepID=UPI00387B859B
LYELVHFNKLATSLVTFSWVRLLPNFWLCRNLKANSETSLEKLELFNVAFRSSYKSFAIF